MESNKRNKKKQSKVAKEIDFEMLEKELVRKKKEDNNGKRRNDRNKSKRNHQQTRKHY